MNEPSGISNTTILLAAMSALWLLSMTAVGSLYKLFLKRQDELRSDMKEAVANIANAHSLCQSDLHKNYLMVKHFDDWKPGRETLWKNLKGHRHINGQVVLPD